MSFEDGSDSTVETEGSETTDETVDGTTELCEDSDNNQTQEDSEELVEDTKEQEDTELVEKNEAPKTKDVKDAEKEEESNSKTENSETDVDEEDIKAEIKEKSQYSDEVNEHINSVDELEIYQKANLKEEKINGRTCLIRDDIDMDYVDPKTGNTNRELMAKGKSPYDAKTGEKIELHHIGQDFNSPLAELTENTEHGGKNHSTLHQKDGESWRKDSQKNYQYKKYDKPDHWIDRAKGG